MAENITEKFIAALNEIEQNENFDQMVELFTDSSEIGNVSLTEILKGQNGAREFWKSYRDSFDKVSSTFQNKIVSNNLIALEWTTEFNRRGGDDSAYQGVSILEIDGDKITRFFAYFNPHALGEQFVETAQSKEA